MAYLPQQTLQTTRTLSAFHLTCTQLQIKILKIFVAKVIGRLEILTCYEQIVDSVCVEVGVLAGGHVWLLQKSRSFLCLLPDPHS